MGNCPAYRGNGREGRTGSGHPLRSVSIALYDAMVVGAGPYGLSTAAHLLGRGLRGAVFGKTLELWRNHMPQGMLLRSHWWATNLSDPRQQYGFERFFRESQYEKCYPVCWTNRGNRPPSSVVNARCSAASLR